MSRVEIIFARKVPFMFSIVDRIKGQPGSPLSLNWILKPGFQETFKNIAFSLITGATTVLWTFCPGQSVTTPPPPPSFPWKLGGSEHQRYEPAFVWVLTPTDNATPIFFLISSATPICFFFFCSPYFFDSSTHTHPSSAWPSLVDVVVTKDARVVVKRGGVRPVRISFDTTPLISSSATWWISTLIRIDANKLWID